MISKYHNSVPSVEVWTNNNFTFLSRQTLFHIVKDACYPNYHIHLEKVCVNLMPEGETNLQDEHIRNLFFGNYMEPDADPKIYDEV